MKSIKEIMNDMAELEEKGYVIVSITNTGGRTQIVVNLD